MSAIDEALRDFERLASDAAPKPNGNGHQNTAGDENAPLAVTVSLADVMPQTLRWRWFGRIAEGKLTIVAGDPGLGKSFLMLDLASRLSTGTPLPGETTRPEKTATLLLAVEDDLADTTRPRLDALHADVTRVHALTAIRQADGERLPRLDRDLTALEDAIARTGAGLVIVDPINAYMGKVDGNQDIEMRSVLTPLSVLAARTGAGVVAITHTNKRAEGNALHRVMGSLAYVAAARSVLAVGSDPDTPGRRVLVQVKSNLAPLTPSLGFRVVEGAVVWDSDPVSVTAETIFGTPARTPRENSALAEAEQFLRTVLANGRQPAKDIFAEARQVGISEATLRRAKDAVRVQPSRESFGPGGKWYWSLPIDAHRCSSASSDETLSTYEQDEHLWSSSDAMEAF